jgi:hypothetical protein
MIDENPYSAPQAKPTQDHLPRWWRRPVSVQTATIWVLLFTLLAAALLLG